MNIKVDKLKEKAMANKRIILFLSGLSLIGLIFGSLFITIISKTDQTLIQSYIENFMNTVQNNKLNYVDAIKNTLVSNLSFTSIIWMLGISIIGIPIIIFMYFTKSFMIGFSIASFILKYKVKGLIYAIVYIFPHHFINLVAFTLLMVYSIKFSYYLLSSILKKKTIHFKNLMNPYLSVLVIVVVTLLITSIYETFVVPYFIKQLLHIIK